MLLDLAQKYWKYIVAALVAIAAFAVGYSQSSVETKTETITIVDQKLVEEKVQEEKMKITLLLEEEYNKKLEEAKKELVVSKTNKKTKTVIKKPDGTVEQTETVENNNTEKSTETNTKTEEKGKTNVNSNVDNEKKETDKKTSETKTTVITKTETKKPANMSVELSLNKQISDWVDKQLQEKLNYRVGAGVKVIDPFWLNLDYQFNNKSLGLGIRYEF